MVIALSGGAAQTVAVILCIHHIPIILPPAAFDCPAVVAAEAAQKFKSFKTLPLS